MSPVRFVAQEKKEEFESSRLSLNHILAFEGLLLSAEGKLSEKTKAKTLSEAQKREKTLKEELLRRGVHSKVLLYSREELLVDNYFHAVFEAVKSISDRLRELSSLELDGTALIEKVFNIKKPLIVINGFLTESDQSEHKGFTSLLKGVYGTFRNPLAHSAKIKWYISEKDALDMLCLVSYIHRRLDSSSKTCMNY